MNNPYEAGTSQLGKEEVEATPIGGSVVVFLIGLVIYVIKILNEIKTEATLFNPDLRADYKRELSQESFGLVNAFCIAKIAASVIAAGFIIAAIVAVVKQSSTSKVFVILGCVSAFGINSYGWYFGNTNIGLSKSYSNGLIANGVIHLIVVTIIGLYVLFSKRYKSTCL